MKKWVFLFVVGMSCWASFGMVNANEIERYIHVNFDAKGDVQADSALLLLSIESTHRNIDRVKKINQKLSSKLKKKVAALGVLQDDFLMDHMSYSPQIGAVPESVKLQFLMRLIVRDLTKLPEILSEIRSFSNQVSVDQLVYQFGSQGDKKMKLTQSLLDQVNRRKQQLESGLGHALVVHAIKETFVLGSGKSDVDHPRQSVRMSWDVTYRF